MAAIVVPSVASNFICRERIMMSRTVHDAVQIIRVVPPGQITPPCWQCCNAPACCPCMAAFPCCDEPKYIVEKRAASRYLHIRENGIEWNEPQIVCKNGACFGCDPCGLDIQDSVKVLYFDDQMFERVMNNTRCCNECRTCCCGGKGQSVRIDSVCCCGMCVRGTCPCPCVPVCCPEVCCPCMLAHTIYVEDADSAVYQIKEARSNAKQRLGLD